MKLYVFLNTKIMFYESKMNFFSVISSKCYQLGEFENAVNYMNIQAEKILERFFR